MDYGKNKTPSMHHRLGRATLSWQVFPRESKLIFPWKKSHWDNTVVLLTDTDENMYVEGCCGYCSVGVDVNECV